MAELRPLHVTYIDTMGPRTFSWSPKLVGAVSAFEPDLIHLHGLWSFNSVAVPLLARKLGCRFLVSPHGMLDQWALRNSEWKKRIAWFAYEHRQLISASCVHVLNLSELSAIRHLGLSNPAAVIPNGVLLPESEQVSESTLKAPAPFKRLLYLGRLHPKKSVHTLVEAWAASRSLPGASNWRLEIAGTGDEAYVSKIRVAIREMNIEDSVSLLGGRFGVERDQTYRSCAAFILPSLSEGLPMSVLEAWSFGKPVLMTTACNLPDGFEARAAREIGSTISEIKNGLGSLFDMRDLELSEMGVRGLALVKGNYQWSTIADRMISTYRWLSAGGERPDFVLS